MQAHGFGAAGDDDARDAGADALIGDGDGLKARGAEAVDGGAGDFDGQAGAQSGHAGDVPALLAFGLRAAEDDVVDFGDLLESRNPFQSSAQRNCGEVVGTGGGKRTFGGAAYGCAHGGDKDGFRHG